jgi:hypothetical protein
MFGLISDLAKIQDDLSSTSSYNWQNSYHESLKNVIKDIELDDKAKEKVKKVESLLYTMMDSFQKYSIYNIPYETKKQLLQKIFDKHQVEQRSGQWYDDMKIMLTASEFHYLFETPRTIENLILSKINVEKRDIQKAIPTEMMVATSWGIRFEPVVKRYLENLWESKIYDCGRLKHDTEKNLGASPDGIIIESKDPLRYGRLVEIKCPYSRKIGEGIPFKYWVQMQIQMEVTNLVECEYVEVEIASKTAKEPMKILPESSLESDKIYLVEKNNEYMYIYEKDELLKEDYNLIEEIPYAIVSVYNVCVKRDTQWYESTKDLQKTFWEKVDMVKSGEHIIEPRVKRSKISNTCLIQEEPL